MDQEKNEEINEQEQKNKKSNRTLIILIIILLALGLYYYYNNTSLKENKTPEQQEITVIKVKKNPSKPVIKPEIKKEAAPKIEKTEKIAKKTIKITFKKAKKTEQTAKKNDINNLIRPTDKAFITKLALKSAGKTDPFTGMTGKMLASGSRGASFSNIDSIQSISSLPAIGDLPQLSLPGGLLTSNMLQIEEPVTIKGFIGNKVIVNINGMDESLTENESFQGVKVVKVDSANLTAVFMKNKKIITKNIKTLQ